MAPLSSALVSGLRSLTIEPVILLFTVGYAVTAGSELNKKLIMTQLCVRDLNLTFEVSCMAARFFFGTTY
jgi:hypothetical protein